MDQEITETAFVNEWSSDPQNAKSKYLYLKSLLEHTEGVELDFKARPTVTYSLRGRHTSQTARDLFVMIDVIDDDPTNRWLSVCFYADMVQDPEELSDMVPEGLLGEDAVCFDLDTDTEVDTEYVAARLKEAIATARAASPL